MTRAALSVIYFNPRSSYEERLFDNRKPLITDISIHAPHTRSDLPCVEIVCEPCTISIHAPHTRSDDHLSVRPDEVAGISIHAPHTRSDSSHPARQIGLLHFNPRSSYEERPARNAIAAHVDEISIHAPHTRSDCVRCRKRPALPGFQSTLLIRGATKSQGG